MRKPPKMPVPPASSSIAGIADTPSFPRHDPADQAFWDVRFSADFTPWDQGAVPQSFQAFVDLTPTPQRTLIPGCGSAHEVKLLASRGWDVTAIDFSEAAVNAARQVLGADAKYVRQQDFFDSALGEAPYTLVYERAFLCALPVRLREAWAKQMAKLIAPQGNLVGFFFVDEMGDSPSDKQRDPPKGPPFLIMRHELDHLMMANGFRLIEESNPPDSIAVFRGKERWMIWQRQ
jgi:Thiopurine S-methyltransferase (TPMT)